MALNPFKPQGAPPSVAEKPPNPEKHVIKIYTTFGIVLGAGGICFEFIPYGFFIVPEAVMPDKERSFIDLALPVKDIRGWHVVQPPSWWKGRLSKYPPADQNTELVDYGKETE